MALLFAVSGACQSSERAVESPAPHPAQDRGAIWIELERTTCFGSCPAYRVSVDDDGNVRYEGDQFVAQTGVREWQVKPEVVEHLQRLFDRVRFLDMDFDCKRVIYDAPTMVITLRSAGRERTIRNMWSRASELRLPEFGLPLEPDLDAHALLDWLGNWIDLALGTEPYVHSEQPR